MLHQCKRGKKVRLILHWTPRPWFSSPCHQHFTNVVQLKWVVSHCWKKWCNSRKSGCKSMQVTLFCYWYLIGQILLHDTVWIQSNSTNFSRLLQISTGVMYSRILSNIQLRLCLYFVQCGLQGCELQNALKCCFPMFTLRVQPNRSTD